MPAKSILRMCAVICLAFPLFAYGQQDSLQTKQPPAAAKEYEEQIKDLKKQISRLENKLSNIEKSKLMQSNKTLQNENQAMKDKLAAAETAQKGLQARLGELEPFAAEFTAEFIRSNEAYLAKPFAEIDTVQVQTIMDKCRQYGKYAGMPGLADKCRLTLQLAAQYRSLQAPLGEAYDNGKVEAAITGLSALQLSDEGKRQEVNKTKELLSDYSYALSCMNSLIRNVNDEIKGVDQQKSPENLKERVRNSILKMIDSQEKYVTVIPYLKPFFDDYKKRLTADTFTDTSDIANQIAGMYAKVPRQ